MATSQELAAWRYTVCAELVWEALPDRAGDAKDIGDVATNAVFVYEKTRDEWQKGDPNFDLYNDWFICKSYIINQWPKIRDILRQANKHIGWTMGKGEGNVYKVTDPDEIARFYELQARMVEGTIESYNGRIEQVHSFNLDFAARLPRFSTERQLTVAD